MGLDGNVVMEVIHVIFGKNYTASCEDKRTNLKKTMSFSIMEQNMYVRSVDHNDQFQQYYYCL